jgi:hypothetical protein
MRRQQPVGAGIWLGLLAYKPQLAAVLVLVLAFGRQWRILAVAGLVIGSLVGLGMAVAGPGWPLSFYRLVSSDYYQHNAMVADGVRSISVPAVLRYLAGKHTLWTTLIDALVGLTALAVLWRLWRGIDPVGDRFALQYAAVIVTTLLVSPHALFYEAGLLVLPMIALADHWHRLGRFDAAAGLVITLVFGLGYLWPFAPMLGVEPLAILLPLLAVLLWRELAGTPPQIAADLDRSRLRLPGGTVRASS